MKNPQTTIATTFLTHIISAIDGVRDLKFWLHAYFFILLSCAKFQQGWTTLILNIL